MSMSTIYLYVLIYVYILSHFQETSEIKKKFYIYSDFLKKFSYTLPLWIILSDFCLLPLKKPKKQTVPVSQPSERFRSN